MKKIAIVGIHTGIGKTIISAVLVEALSADYWKPVQAGLEERDSDIVRNLVSTDRSKIHPEAITLTKPLSPHAAAKIDGVNIDFTKFNFPITNSTLIIETAGGIMSPISANKTMIDFLAYYQLPVILVVKHYLGSINHTLLSIEMLRKKNILTYGIVISGQENSDSEEFIETYSGTPIIFRVPEFKVLNRNLLKDWVLNNPISFNF